ncbi:hypothetical protein EST38_g13688 [Candolleomyces aberdarensis]|uniref:Uncharacterized protein n=1 Tax=Candolleomyces aberdarensis TaxID=2316362 RepID=A0A4Q2D1L3_9AGAR|nr:hypothetical protein EST38_g13688 [Candolleomyces aberdarensis]
MLCLFPIFLRAIDTMDSTVQRLKSTSRKLVVKPAIKTVRRTLKHHRKRTNTEKKEAKASRDAHRHEVSQALDKCRQDIWAMAVSLREQFSTHTVEYWHASIIQATSHKRSRKLHGWNAYLSKETRRINNEANDGTIVRANDVAAELAIKWNSMSEEEKSAATGDYIKDFEAKREEKIHLPNVGLKAFHDVRANLAQMHADAGALHARTGIEILTFAVRSKVDDFNRPFFFATTPRFEEFFSAIFKTNLMETSIRLEGFIISGFESVTRNYAQGISALKSEVAKFIHLKLDEAAGYHIPRMLYTNFDSNITLPHQIIVKGWPLPKFSNPSDIGTKGDLDRLLSAWKTGSAYFEKLDDAVFEKWSQEYYARFDSPSTTATDPSGDTSTTASPINDTHAMDSTQENILINHASEENLPATLPPPTALTTVNSSDPFVSCMISGDGGVIVHATKKPRKQRSDKGKPRGSRKSGKENAPPAM